MIRSNRAMRLAAFAVLGNGIALAAEGLRDSYPNLVTAETRKNAETLAALERPGNVFFRDGFESPESLKKYFEIRGLREGRAKLITDGDLAHRGSGAIQFTAVAKDGRASGAGATGWFGPNGYDRVYTEGALDASTLEVHCHETSAPVLRQPDRHSVCRPSARYRQRSGSRGPVTPSQRIVFLGDSITFGGRYVAHHKIATRSNS